MKKIGLTLVLICFLFAGYSQSDTLYTKKNQKIACKIIEITEYDIVYSLPDGPRYVVNKASVIKYTLASGYSEILLPDELSIENEHMEIIKNRQVIKTSPFSLINNHISLSYEKVIKVGMNLDMEVGYINNSLNSSPIFPNTPFVNAQYSSNGSYYSSPVFYSGAYVKPGLKFFMGKDYSVKGLKYAHPLKGPYMRLDFALSFINFQNVSRFEFAQQSYPYGPPTPIRKISTNVNSIAYGGFVNFGRQFILGNLLTMEFYVGFGFTGQSYSFSNPEYLKDASANSHFIWSGEGKSQARRVYNYHGFLRAPGVGLSGTTGFRVGYILPDKSAKKAPVIPQN